MHQDRELAHKSVNIPRLFPKKRKCKSYGRTQDNKQLVLEKRQTLTHFKKHFSIDHYAELQASPDFFIWRTQKEGTSASTSDLPPENCAHGRPRRSKS